VAVVDQLSDAVGLYGHAVLVVLDLFGNAYDKVAIVDSSVKVGGRETYELVVTTTAPRRR
jgi:hypothetical protein